MTDPERALMVPPRVRFVQMGQLDDAIRDHLELLRRRGADPTDIARAEAEALGPAVREVSDPDSHEESDDLLAGTAPPPAAEGDLFEDDPVVAPDETDLDGVGDLIETDEDDSDLELEDEFEDESGDEAESAVQSQPDQPTELFDAFADDGIAEDVAEDEGDLDDPALHSHDAEVEEADEGDEEDPSDRLEPTSSPAPGHGEDVLEETPDFLAESPDHDKLWFEQSGPRDFDFDGEK